MKDPRGATAIEYALLAAIITIGIITALTKIGSNVSSTFTSVASTLR